MPRLDAFAALAAAALALSGCVANAEELSAGTLPFPTEPSPATAASSAAPTADSSEDPADSGTTPGAEQEAAAGGGGGGGAPLPATTTENATASTGHRPSQAAGSLEGSSGNSAAIPVPSPAAANAPAAGGAAAPLPRSTAQSTVNVAAVAAGLSTVLATERRNDGEAYSPSMLNAYASCVAERAYPSLGATARGDIAAGGDDDAWRLTDAEEDALDAAEDYCEGVTGW